MAVNTQPVFGLAPICAVASIATANTNRDGTGTIGTVYTPGSNGGRIEFIRVQATGTTTAGVVRLYIHDGTTAQLYKEIIVPAITPSTTIEAFSAVFIPDRPIVLPSTHSLRASTHNAETFKVFAHAADF